MKTALLALLLLTTLGSSLAYSASDTDLNGLPPPPARSDRLDIFGAGMCHQCEWRPRAKVMAAAEECGVGADGVGNPATFECGRTPSCDTVCNFVRCGSP
jgi:hypothetical protein